MLLKIQGKAFNPQQVVSMEKDVKYNNTGNATRYRLLVRTERETLEFIYPNDKQSRDEDFDKIIDAANGKQADTPQTDRTCNKCEWHKKYGRCIFEYCHYEYEQAHKDTPQTDWPKMTEEEIDTMLARALVSGQTDRGWK